MGKTSKFFKSLFGFKTPEPTAPSPENNKQPKRRWSFIKSHREKPHHHHISGASGSFDASLSGTRATPLHRYYNFSDDIGGGDGCNGSSNHAIAVAAATAAVAEAAVAAAQAAAEVVRMTSKTAGAGAGYGLRAEWAAVKIQSHFRAYLARRALRALKALVRLQALVRGHIERKKTADRMRRFQALLRVQSRARAGRFHIADSPKGPQTPEKIEHVIRSRSIKHDHPSVTKNNGSKSYARGFTDGEKILEIDTTKPHITHPRRRTLFQSDHICYSHSQSLTTSRGSTVPHPGPSPTASYEVNSQTTPFIEEELSFCTAQNSPPFYSVSSKGNGSMRVDPFTPAKSDGSRSCLSGYSDHPNYMAYTESSRAKVRSLSAPRQRLQFEVPSTVKRCSVYGYGLGAPRGSNLRDSFMSKAYPGSGRLDQLGMPVGGLGFRESEFSGGYWN